jgi:hypothetical protein
MLKKWFEYFEKLQFIMLFIKAKEKVTPYKWLIVVTFPNNLQLKGFNS